MDQNEFKTMLENLQLGWTSYVETTTSTNDIALEWVHQGAPHLSVIAANHQSRGRGRAGRTWHTYPGTALAFSIILRPEMDIQYFSRFTALGTIAVCSTLNHICFTQPQIKWPNDVTLQKKKTAGVLTEIVWSGNHAKAVVIGIGVNIEKGSIPPNEGLNFPATFVADHTEKPLDRLNILYGILSEIKTWYSRIDSAAFLQKWEENLAFRGEKVTALLNSPKTLGNKTNPPDPPTPENTLVHGTLIGITSEGLLTLELADGQIQNFAANEIKILADA